MRISAADMGTAVARLGIRPFDVTGRPMRDMIAAAGGTLDDMTPQRWISQAASYLSRPAAEVVAALSPPGPGAS